MKSRYAHDRQIKRSRSHLRKLKTFLARVVRDIKRKCQNPDPQLKHSLDLSQKILNQKRNDSNKVYSIHAPEFECISKGKTHKKYEFVYKLPIVTTSKKNASIDQVERLSIQRPQQAFVDQGYKGKNNYTHDVEVMVAGRKKKATHILSKFFKQRSVIETIIGYLKTDLRMSRNFLLGKLGDRVNAILSGCAFNLRKTMNLFEQADLSARIAM